MEKSLNYDDVACELVGVSALPLALPRWPTDDTPVHYPGGLTDNDEDELQFQCVVSRVCRQRTGQYWTNENASFGCDWR
jgi:hypothetical protein